MTVLEQVKQAINEAEAAPGMPIKLVAIDGHGGAGKSQLAQRLSRALHAEILHTDDFASMSEPLEWARLTSDVLEPIKAGVHTISYERKSWWENHHPSPVKDQPVTPIMLLEGVGSSRELYRPFLAYAVWVQAPREVYQARGIARDLAENPDGKSTEQLLEIWEKWHTYEDEYVNKEEPQKHADVIVDGTKSYE